VADEESALAKAVKAGEFGINLLPGQPEQLAATFRDLAQNQPRLRDWGRAGREYVKHFERDHVLADFREKLKSLV
jgi:glycosyltransferase involved in cell wall biosynthesis